MEEEYQESDVVFSSHSSYNYQSTQPNLRKTKTKNKHMVNKTHFSVPMNIPENEIRYVHMINYDDHLDGDDDVEGVGEDRLPPHLIVAQRVNNIGRELMACSFCIEDGKGRILKGRNLCEVRNSILRLTGFYET